MIDPNEGDGIFGRHDKDYAGAKSRMKSIARESRTGQFASCAKRDTPQFNGFCGERYGLGCAGGSLRHGAIEGALLGSE
jgi:hypothetical protein